MSKKLRIIIVSVLFLILIGSRGAIMTSKPAAKLGAVDGKLAACPNKPNCVNSQSTDEKYSIAPLELAADESAADAWARLQTAIKSAPRARIVSESDGYMHCEFRTALMRYVDDVEFLLDADARKIDFRSASRLGYSDMGANRKRMEQLRKEFDNPTSY